MMQKIVVAGFIVKEGKVLLAKRPKSKKLAPDKYHLPGGHVEYGEDLKSALSRELREEFGIDVEVDEPFFSFSYSTEDAHTIGLVCPAAICSSALDLTLNSETDHIVWSDEATLVQSLRPDDHNFLAAKAGFAKLYSSKTNS